MSPEFDIDVEHMMDVLGINNYHRASGGAELNYACPFAGHAHGDENPSAYMNMQTTAWYCFGCHERGRNAVSFVAKVMGVEYATAARYLREAYGVAFHEPEGGSMAAETEARFSEPAPLPTLRRPDESWQGAFRMSFEGSPSEDYILSRGITRETAERWGLGHDFHSHRLTIPVHDVDGTLVGLKGRALDDTRRPKYLIIGDRQGSQDQHYGFDPYESSEVVFGLHRERDCKELIICEGEFNAIKLEQIGEPRPVAIGMSYFSDRHMMLIAQEAERAIGFLDSDKAGIEGIWGHENTASGRRLPGLVERLQPHMPVALVGHHEGDPMSMSKEQCQELISGALSALAQQFVFG